MPLDNRLNTSSNSPKYLENSDINFIINQGLQVPPILSKYKIISLNEQDLGDYLNKIADFLFE